MFQTKVKCPACGKASRIITEDVGSDLVGRVCLNWQCQRQFLTTKAGIMVTVVFDPPPPKCQSCGAPATVTGNSICPNFPWAFCDDCYRLAAERYILSLRKAEPEPSPEAETWRDRPPLL